MMVLLVAVALAAPSQPKLDWSLFPEGTTELPRKVNVLECQPGADEPRLNFVPGKVLEYLYEDNDCSLAEGLRFPS